MFWIIAIIILIVICWPFLVSLLSPVAALLVTVIAAPYVWILKIKRRPRTQAEEDKLSEDAAKMAGVTLLIGVLLLLFWLIFRSI